MNITTRAMSDKHEDFLAALLDGRKMKGSGNQWQNPSDGRQSSREQEYAFSWDGKATLGKSVGVTRQMWEKIREQAIPERPAVPLRWYNNESLEVGLDLIVVDVYDFSAMQADANAYHRLMDKLGLDESWETD